MDRADLAKLEPEQVARWFHEAYERLAPDFGYEVRADIGQRPYDDLPVNNRELMEATAAAVLEHLAVPVLLRRLDLAEQALTVAQDALGSRFVIGPQTRADLLDQARAALAVLRRPLDQPDDTT